MALNMLLITFLLLAVTCNAKQPHIVFFVADDLGWADVGYHGSDIPTPHIDALASSGIELNNYYVQYICSPSRGALMTGRYPLRYGFQSNVIIPAEPEGLSVNETVLPQYLKNAGYVTRIVGKWHLGFARWAYTPTYRGFDSFYGYYNAEEDHFAHTISDTTYPPPYGGHVGYDFRRNLDVDWTANGTYGTLLFNKEVVSIIENHNQSNPLFVLYTFQNNHSPLQVPDSYLANCPHVTNATRKIYCAMGTAMDEAIGNVTAALSQAGMLNDTLFIFTADNGGYPPSGGLNQPYRGGKFTVWEGGVKATAFISGYGVTRSGTSNALMHITDWVPTLAHLVGSTLTPANPLDGFDLWEAIINDTPSPRTEIILNVDPVDQNGGIRSGDWKLVYGPPQYDGYFLIPNATVNFIPAPYYNNKVALFNLSNDPTELNDVSAFHPDVVETLLLRILDYQDVAVEPILPSVDPASFPELHGGAWSPWLD